MGLVSVWAEIVDAPVQRVARAGYRIDGKGASTWLKVSVSRGLMCMRGRRLRRLCSWGRVRSGRPSCRGLRRRPVVVPAPELEALRDLVRAREDLRGDLMGAHHRLSKLLLRHGLIWTGPGEAAAGPDRTAVPTSQSQVARSRLPPIPNTRRPASLRRWISAGRVLIRLSRPITTRFRAATAGIHSVSSTPSGHSGISLCPTWIVSLRAAESACPIPSALSST
jgi:hypothetical protein